jgi:PAS domain-containing protein
MLLIGVMKLAAYLGLPFQIDRSSFTTRRADNVMAPNTAVTFMLISVALILMDVKVQDIRVTPWLALCALGVALLALVGYAYNIDALIPLSRLDRDGAQHGHLFLRAGAGHRRGAPETSAALDHSFRFRRRLISRRLLPAAVLVPVLVGFIALAIARHEWLGPELAVLLFTLTTIAVFVGLTAWMAGRLHRLDLENRQTLQRLQRAEAIYHSLVQTLPQNIFRKNLEGKFTFGNRHFCQTLDRSLDDIVGKSDFDFYGRRIGGSLPARRHGSRRRGKTIDVVEQHVTPHGDHLYVQVIKTPVRGCRRAGDRRAGDFLGRH